MRYLIEFSNFFNIKLFSTIFISIFLEALPFLLLGAILSSVIEVFVSEDFLKNIIPKNLFLGLLVTSFVGLVFPVCECAIVPVINKLLKKGVPLYICITLMLSVPIVNATVIISTFYAFLGYTDIFVLRIALGVIIPMVIGYILVLFKKEMPKVEIKTNVNCGCGNEHESAHDHESQDKHVKQADIFSMKANMIIEHGTEEFFETGKFFIIGTCITSIFQTIVPRNIFTGIGGNLFLSIALMMTFAFFLSVCSNTDAFIARSLIGQFTQGSVLAFIVFGAMIDLKNSIMLMRIFNKKFVIYLILLIFTVCFIITGFLGKFFLSR